MRFINLRGRGVRSAASARMASVTLAFLAAMLLLARTGAWAQPSPEPLITADEMLSVDQIRPGMKGYGKSVFEGTRIERFDVTVLGVLRKIDFGGDMILIRVDSGFPVSSGSGVSAGMSGSPIYVNDRLIGALAFGWSFTKQPVAGVTPIAQMLDNYRPGSAPAAPSAALTGDLRPEGGPLKLDGQLFSRATVVPEPALAPPGAAAHAGGTLYLSPVATPLMVSGMGRAGIDGMRRRFGRYSVLVQPGPGRAELPPGERPRIEPGSAVGVQLLGGDVDSTAIGTVTYVKGDHVIAFGHPMFGLGSIDLPMTTAYVHGVISSQSVSFKLGAPVETVGAISQDRNWSIGGRVGQTARTVPAEFLITDADRGVRREYRIVAAVHKDLTSQLLYESLLNAVNSVSPPSSGTTRGTLEIWPKGMPVIRRENVFAVGDRRSAIEQLFGDPFAGMPLVELMQILEVLENNAFGRVAVDRLRVTVDISEVRKTAAIERAYADRKRVKPGDRVKIGVVVQPVNAPKEFKEYEVEIPRNIPGGRLQIGVAGGSSAERVRQYMQVVRPQAKTLPQLVAQIADRERNSDLTIEVAQPVVGVSVAGREFPNLPNVVVEVLTGANPSGIRMIRSHTKQTHATPWVLSGGQLLTLQVDADEKDKSGQAAAPGTGMFGGFGSLLDLFRYGVGGEVDGDIGGGDDGLLDGADDGIMGAYRIGPAPRASDARRRGAAAPDDPKMPSFDELQRILDGDEDTTADAGAAGGGAVTSVRKSIARAPGLWKIDTAREFQGGKLDGVLISSRGAIALAPQAAPLLTAPERFFWAQATDRAGNVYVGGWLDGSILKIDPQGKSTRVFAGQDDVAISALTIDGDGTLYAAAEPTGTVYRIPASGEASVLCRLPEHRIWVLRRIGDVLYAGTGSEGHLYRIGMDGKVSVAFTAPDRHVFALTEDGSGGLYCGTYPRGKLFRLRSDRVEPVYELPNATVTALASDTKGNLYVGTSPKASVIRITPAGDVSTLFQSREKHVFALLVDDAGYVYAGVGGQARVYRIAPDKTVSTLWDPQAAYVLSMTRDAEGNLYATTAGPTQVVRLSAKPASSGSFTSAVLNAGNLARWGAVRWSGTPAGIQIRTRSGNTAYPDATWSAWSASYSRAAGEPVTSPAGQYLQYRIVMEGSAAQAPPVLNGIELFYRARNRAPEITLKSPSAGELLSGTRPIRWTARDADGDRLKYDVYFAREGTDRWVKIGTRSGKPASGDGALEEPGSELSPDLAPTQGNASSRPVVLARRALGPQKSRPVRTRTRRRPLQSGAAGPSEVPTPSAPGEMAGELPEQAEESLDDLMGDGPSLTWNTKRVSDGRYRVKIVVTDVLGSPDEAATAEVVSEVLQIDNSAPVLAQAPAARPGAPPAEIAATDSGAYVASAEYRVDRGDWIGAAARDGIFDSPQETVVIRPTELKAGRHVLEVRVRDAAGNEATRRIPYLKR